MKKYILSLFLLVSLVSAQQSIDSLWAIPVFPFNDQERMMAIYIPSGVTKSSTINIFIGLHGFSHSPTVFRDELAPFAEKTKTVIICPSGNGDRHDDEFGGGQELAAIVEESAHLIYFMGYENVDSIYIGGYSFGGRSALSMALNNPTLFKGIIPMVPAIQSIADANNQFPGLVSLPFINSDKVPTCFCMTNNDNFYAESSQLYSNMAGVPGKVKWQEDQSNAGHDYVYPGYSDSLANCLSYFSSVGSPNAKKVYVGNNKVLVYPNPAINQITVRLKKYKAGASVRLFDTSGKEVLNAELPDTSTTIQLPDSLARGLYTIQVHGIGPVFTDRLVIN